MRASQLLYPEIFNFLKKRPNKTNENLTHKTNQVPIIFITAEIRLEALHRFTKVQHESQLQFISFRNYH